jgi:propanol-preferring alcohol dehydrogenase
MTAFPDRSMPVDPRRLVFREAGILGSRYATKREVTEAAALVASGTVRPIIGETVAPSGLLELHDRLERGLLLGRGALDWRGLKGGSTG